MTAEEIQGREAALQAEIERLRAALASEAAAAQAERDRLTFELGHRVKNTLSVVQALANQTLRNAASPETALTAFGDRLMALARANDVILKDSWTTATVEATARCVLMPHGTAAGRLGIEGPDVRLRASAALSFAMALHELATNAKRYGAWSGGGDVALSWTRPDETGGLFTLTWAETDGPVPAAPAKRGFGLRLIEQCLRSAFGRDVRFAFEAPGFSCTVRAPVAEVMA